MIRQGAMTVLILGSLLSPRVYAEEESSLAGLSVLMEVYTYKPGTFEVKRTAVVSLAETLGSNRPKGANWLLRPKRNPSQPFSKEEWEAIVHWTRREAAPGLVMDGHSEIEDQDLKALETLKDLTLLSLRKTRITDLGLDEIGRLKAVHFLDVSDTAVSRSKLAALNARKKITRLPDHWSDPWLLAPPPDTTKHEAFWFGKSPDSGIPGEVKNIQVAADYSLPLVGLDGRKVLLSSQKGKVILLNFWATWCVPCRSELPGLENLYATLKGQGIFFAYVTYESPVVVQEFLAKHPMPLPVYFARMENIASYVSSGIPVTVVISKKGYWAIHQMGAVKWDTEDVMKFLLKLTQES